MSCSGSSRRCVGLNPLHCGAVVASRAGYGRLSAAVESQSPSLRGSGRFRRWCASATTPKRRSQSPSLRGSGRFERRAARLGADLSESQSPSLRGSGRFRRREVQDRRDRPLSQSPSLRGSGRFQLFRLGPRRRFLRLNPLHCGAVVASYFRGPRVEIRYPLVSIPFIAGQWSLLSVRADTQGDRGDVSIPFIAGQWSLPPDGDEGRPDRPAGRLNPLHCGAVVASASRFARSASRCAVSIPFIAGQWSLQLVSVGPEARERLSQSPSLRGSGRFHVQGQEDRVQKVGLNPLHCGAVVASSTGFTGSTSGNTSLNPLHCGAVVASRRG